MYARIATADIVPGMMDRFVEQTHEIMIPAYIGKPGLLQATILLDRTNEVGRLLTVWRSQADMMAREQDTAYRSRMDNVRAKAVPIFYEVCAHESGDPNSYAFARVTSGDVLSGQSEIFSRKLREEAFPLTRALMVSPERLPCWIGRMRKLPLSFSGTRGARASNASRQVRTWTITARSKGPSFAMWLRTTRLLREYGR